jgi:protoporphyrinogen oxidase
MYAARRSGLKKEMFGYVKGGYAKIINAFETKLSQNGVTIKTGHKVVAVGPQNNTPCVSLSSGETEQFDRIIITLPSDVAAGLCSGILSPQEKAAHEAIQYLGVICASVVLKKPISPYYVTNITDTWVPFTGIIEMSALVDKKYFNGNTLLYLPKYIEPSNPLFEKTDEEIQAQFLQALFRMYPELNSDAVKFMGIARAKKVFALTTLGYTSMLPPITTSAPGVYIINAAQITDGTLNVNETIRVADRFYKLALD